MRGRGAARGRACGWSAPKRMPSEDGEPPRPPRVATPASVGAVHALAVPMLAARPRSTEFLGVLSIARRRRRFSHEEEELLQYLAGQAVVSIENATLHETVERQAVTDELTGLANLRAFHSILEQRDRARAALQHAAGAGDARPRPLQAGQRRVRPPAGRRGARAGRRRAARLLARHRRARSLRRRGAGRGPARRPTPRAPRSWPSASARRSSALEVPRVDGEGVAAAHRPASAWPRCRRARSTGRG